MTKSEASLDTMKNSKNIQGVSLIQVAFLLSQFSKFFKKTETFFYIYKVYHVQFFFDDYASNWGNKSAI